MKINESRLAIGNQIYKTQASVKVSDIVDEHQKVCGTKVQIEWSSSLPGIFSES
ncbi:MAG: hypothetical protein OEQ53_22600 [Saprospiraceae bacterium]|nr:hypothetical protein [Saprospiraceae bacterium]